MKLLALDIGGVCLNLTPERTYNYFGLDPEKPLPEDWNNAVDAYNRGTMDSKAFAEALRNVTGKNFSDSEVQYGWNLYLGTERKDTTKLLENFRSNGWKIVFFSDTQPWHIVELRKILSYSALIPDGIYSFEAGAEKPSEIMYRTFQNTFGKPDLYLDDRQCNIDGGLAFGWNAVRYS